jgi:hypothetical protein
MAKKSWIKTIRILSSYFTLSDLNYSFAFDRKFPGGCAEACQAKGKYMGLFQLSDMYFQCHTFGSMALLLLPIDILVEVVSCTSYEKLL